MHPIPTRVPGLVYYENMVPDSFHDDFVKQLNTAYYEQNVGHYDGFSFRDDNAFDAVFYPMVKCLFQKMKALKIFKACSGNKLKLGCSLIGYEKNGFIKRHIDAPNLSGDTVVVFSFYSPCVIHFYQENSTHKHEKIMISHKSMYVMSGESRYQWSHEILANDDQFNGKPFTRAKRYSLLLFEPGSAYQEEILAF